jgi:hypothetical protein
VERRLRDRLERRQRRRLRNRVSGAVRLEQRELPRLEGGLGHPGRRRGVGVAVETDEDARPAALQLERRFGRGAEVVDLESSEHPTDRRPLVGRRLTDGACDDQPVDGARHRDVVEAPPLRLRLLAARCAHLLVRARGLAHARRRVGDPEAEAAVGECEDLVSPGRGAVAAGVGDDDHLEFEPLRGMDRQQADHIGVLLLRDRFELARAGLVLVAHEPDETLDVGPPELLVRSCEPCELAQVRVPAAPVPLCEHREVVVVGGDDLLAQPLEREPARRGDKAVVALPERTHEPLVSRREARRQRPLQTLEQRPLRGGATKQHQRVVRDAHER